MRGKFFTTSLHTPPTLQPPLPHILSPHSVHHRLYASALSLSPFCGPDLKMAQHALARKYHAELMGANTRIFNLESTVAELEEKVKLTEEKVGSTASLKRKITLLEKARDEAVARQREFEGEAAANGRRLAETMGKGVELEGKLESAKETETALRLQLEGTSTRCEELEAQISTLLGQLDAGKEEVERLQKELKGKVLAGDSGPEVIEIEDEPR